MFIDICIGAVSLAFVILVIYLIVSLRKIQGTLKQTNRTLVHVDQLSKTANDIALDLKEKSEALNVVFKPLAKLNKKKAARHSQAISDVVQFAAEGITLYNQLKKKKK